MADDWEVVRPGEQKQAARPGADLWEKVSSPKPAEGLGDKLWGMLKAGGRGAIQGMADVGMGTTQLLSHALPGQGGERARSDIQQQIQQAGESYAASPSVQQHPWAAGAGRFGGNVLGTAPLSAIPGLGTSMMAAARMGPLAARAAGTAAPGVEEAVRAQLMARLAQVGATGETALRMGGGAAPAAAVAAAPAATGAGLTSGWAGPALGSRMAQLGARAGSVAAAGAAGSATAPVERGDYWPEKMKQLMFGGGFGATLGTVGGLIGPQITAPVQKLMQTFPNLVRMGSGVEGRTGDVFQRAMGNQVLEPLSTSPMLKSFGQPLPRNTKSGDDLVNTVHDRLSDAYDEVLPHITFDGRDPSFHRRLAQLTTDAKNDLSDAAGNQWDRYMKTYLGKPIRAGGGSLTGESFKRVEERLGAQTFGFLKSSVKDEQIFGEHLGNVLELMRDTAIRQNPEYGPELQVINSAYHRYVTMAEAANRNVDARRNFTPHDVMATLGAGGARARRQMSPDDGLMRAFAEAGDSMLQGKSPSWTRLLGHVTGSVGGFAAGGAVGHPVLGMGAGSYAGAELGGRMASGLRRITERPEARAIGGAISGAAPGVGAAAGRRRDTLTEAVPSIGGS